MVDVKAIAGIKDTKVLTLMCDNYNYPSTTIKIPQS